MMASTVKLSIPFASLVDSIGELSLKEKYQLWKMLEEQVGQLEEELLEKDEAVLLQIKQAKEAYRTGDYETIDEYVAKRKRNSL